MGVFIEVEFPRTISFKAMGGPGFSTTVNSGFSGFEQRNQNWLQARAKWQLAVTTPSEATSGEPTTQDFIDQLTSFFLVAGGQANGFRLKDHKDWTSSLNGVAKQLFGIGDGNTGTFQLIKTYSVGNLSYVRPIIKPITSLVLNYQNEFLNDSVSVFLGSNQLTGNPGYVGGGSAQFTLDETTGQVSFNSATVVSISNVSVSNGVATYTYAVVSGPGLAKNQQIVTTNCGTGNNGTIIITAVDTGTFSAAVPGANTATGLTGKGVVSSSNVSITGATQSGTSTTYSYTGLTGQALVVGMRATVASMTNAQNNVTGYITALGSGTFTIVNAGGITESGSSGTGLTDWVPATNGLLYGVYQYHFPVRFDSDDLDLQLEDSNVVTQPLVTWNSIVLRELRMESGSQG